MYVASLTHSHWITSPMFGHWDADGKLRHTNRPVPMTDRNAASMALDSMVALCGGYGAVYGTLTGPDGEIRSTYWGPKGRHEQDMLAEHHRMNLENTPSR